jgi:hypothetical protein
LLIDVQTGREAWRLVTARLELLVQLINSVGFGEDDDHVAGEPSVGYIAASFDHPSVEVRNAAVEACAASYAWDPALVKR